MGYNDPTYVIFDGDKDKWAYAYMRGWKKNEKIDFDFRDAHDLDNMTSRAQNEEYVKRQLRQRMKESKQVIVLIGANTKNLYRFVRWELDLARELDLPIIAVNLNDKRRQDDERCPPIIRDTCVVHVSFNMAIIKYALENWPSEYRRLPAEVKGKGWRYYSDDIYRGLGL